MRKKQLTYRFHNPNSEKALEDYIQKIIVHNGVREIFTALQDEKQEESQAELTL